MTVFFKRSPHSQSWVAPQKRRDRASPNHQPSCHRQDVRDREPRDRAMPRRPASRFGRYVLPRARLSALALPVFPLLSFSLSFAVRSRGPVPAAPNKRLFFSFSLPLSLFPALSPFPSCSPSPLFSYRCRLPLSRTRRGGCASESAIYTTQRAFQLAADLTRARARALRWNPRYSLARKQS